MTRLLDRDVLAAFCDDPADGQRVMLWHVHAPNCCSIHSGSVHVSAFPSEEERPEDELVLVSAHGPDGSGQVFLSRHALAELAEDIDELLRSKGWR